MKRRRRWLWIALTLVLLAALVVWLEPTRIVWGWLAGEPFYAGRPMSYWRHELHRWGMVYRNDEGVVLVTPWGADIDLAELKREGYVADFHRRPDWLERAWNKIGGQPIPASTGPPALLAGDPEAEAVLQALAAEDDLQALIAYGRAAIAARAAQQR